MSDPRPAHPPAEGARCDAALGPVVLYDGACGLCARSVRWILRRDRRGVFRFASVQSSIGAELVATACTPEQAAVARGLEGIVLIDGTKAFVRSDACAAIARRLPFPWSLGACLALVPRAVREAAYGFVAARRHRWWGPPEACEALRPEWRARLLDRAERRGRDAE
ncbi:MAG TPA: DCC1-like thiol-disulfide oxidoreductase family protein [Phycisphaerales bacterium]|nr:DCC1-like thiol-disulfide oxidoreductase family protein [Phycisphaerales bacterium]HMP38287.1 DCC1-like thiol-disulfide oxidoreductase family protein [Phycisphaerales bacterium]